MMGLDLIYYWTITPKQLIKHIKAFEQRERNRAIEMDFNNWNLGRYLTWAFHDPSNYPEHPGLSEPKKSRVMTSEEMERVMQRNTKILGGKINGT